MEHNRRRADGLASLTERELLVAHTVKIENILNNITDLNDNLSRHYERIDMKVDWRDFKWIVGVIIAGVIGLLGYTSTLSNATTKNSIAITALQKTDIKQLLLQQEKLKLHPYKCTAGKWSIGIGRNLSDKGITYKEALYLFNNDIDQCINDLDIFFFPGQFRFFPKNIQSVLVNMRFQLGHTGLKKFDKMLAAFRKMNYTEAAIQMKDSYWYLQVPKRAKKLITMVEESII